MKTCASSFVKIFFHGLCGLWDFLARDATDPCSYRFHLLASTYLKVNLGMAKDTFLPIRCMNVNCELCILESQKTPGKNPRKLCSTSILENH